MFVSAGEPGNAKKVQVSVAAARKVFRIFGVRTSPALPLHLQPCVCSVGPAAFASSPAPVDCSSARRLAGVPDRPFRRAPAALGAAHPPRAQPAPQPQQTACDRGHQQGAPARLCAVWKGRSLVQIMLTHTHACQTPERCAPRRDSSSRCSWRCTLARTTLCGPARRDCTPTSRQSSGARSLALTRSALSPCKDKCEPPGGLRMRIATHGEPALCGSLRFCTGRVIFSNHPGPSGVRASPGSGRCKWQRVRSCTAVWAAHT